MAYDFTASSSQFLSATNPLSAAPFTLAAHASVSSAAGNKAVVSLHSSTAQRFLLYVTSGGAPSFFVNDAASFTQPQAGTVSANTPFHIAAVEAAANSHKIVLNGTTTTTLTTSRSPTGISGVRIGGDSVTGSTTNLMTGQIAEVGIWNVALTDAEIASLAGGMTCDKVRPQSLVFYAPLVRDLIDAKGGLTITNNNTATVANHPRVYA
jgi:hypothetical protein